MKSLLIASVLSIFSAVALAGGNIPFLFVPGNVGLELVFTNAAISTLTSTCAGAVTVQAKNSGVATNLGSNLTVTLTPSAGLTLYSDSTCSNAITSTVISSGTSSSSFYFLTESASTPTITAEAINYASAQQTETVAANSFIWTGAGANANWNTAANWSGGAVPGSSHQAVFKASCSSNCSPTLTANASIKSVRIEAGYPGTITQGGFTLTIGTDGWVQLGGTFVGSTTGSAISCTGHFIVRGGSFTSTTGTLTMGDPGFGTNVTFTVDNPAFFTHAGGSVAIAPRVYSTVSFSAQAGLNLKNLSVSMNAGTMNVNNDINVTGNLTFNPVGGGTYNGSKILVSGNLNLQGTLPAGSMWVKMIGQDPTITATGTTAGVPSLEIAAAGNVGLVGVIGVYYHYLYTSGTIAAGTSTLRLNNNANGAPTSVTPGAQTYNNVTLAPNNSSTTITGTFNVAGDLNIQFICCGNLNGGIINATGNVLISNGTIAGSTQIQMTGNVSRTLGIPTRGPSPTLTINKTDGAGVTLSAHTSLNATSQTINLVGGNLNMAGFNLTLKANPTLNGNTITKNNGTLTINGVAQAAGTPLFGGTIAP